MRRTRLVDLERAGGRTKIRIISWNLWGEGVPGTYTRDRGETRGAVPDSSATEELLDEVVWPRRRHLISTDLETIGPDVVALQEVATRNGRIAAEELGEHLKFRYVAGKIVAESRLALLSKFEVQNVRELPIGCAIVGYPNPLAADLITEDGTCTAVVVHLPLDRVTDQQPIVLRLVESLSTVGNPLILAGDFNFPPDSPLAELVLAAGLVDASGLAGPTMPNPNPVVRLDYIFVAPAKKWKINRAWTFGEEADADGFLPSDHLGVVVDTKFRELLR